MNGQPFIRNLRLTVRRVIELLAAYPNREELRQEFPKKVYYFLKTSYSISKKAYCFLKMLDCFLKPQFAF
ncbi:MAG: DUF433 domain-containing protein [Nostoc sp.]|uniref:DUF433 domain-containing protein n=1 Tax=Nostoc sp. TaxID=1180 RepID=UPI002FF9B4AC